MPIANLDKRFKQAIKAYWRSRNSQQRKQKTRGQSDTGFRGAVTGGGQMKAVADILMEIIYTAGAPRACINLDRNLELPGYFRPEKKWDIVVVHEKALVCAIELKSQVGPSFGNNFNNRCEEAIGSSTDFWTAFREKRFGKTRKPWLGFFFLLEDTERSRNPVQMKATHFPIDPAFEKASYRRRYALLCQRLVLEKKYDSCCFVTSPKSERSGDITEPDPSLSFQNFAGALFGHVQGWFKKF